MAMTRGRRAHLTLVMLAAAVVAGFGFNLTYAALTYSGTHTCNETFGTADGGAWLRVGICWLAFWTGHMAYGWRPFSWSPRRRSIPGRGSSLKALLADGEATTTQLALMVFFGLITLALAYETFGLFQDKAQLGQQPITHYVRCAIHVANVNSMVVSTAVSFLIGQWLWPGRS